MKVWVSVEEATVGGATTLVGRSAKTRAEWEAARAADAVDLNRLQENGGDVEVYIAPFWSNSDAERCLKELRGFDEADVFAMPIVDDTLPDVLTSIAETEWAGAAYLGDDRSVAATFLHASASLDFPVFLPAFPTGEKVLEQAIEDDLTLPEIENLL